MPGNYNIASDSFTISNLGTFWHMFYVNNGSNVFVGYVNGFDFEIDVITKVMTITNIQYGPSATDQSITSISVAYDWIALPDDSGGNAIFRTTESVYDAYVPSIQNVRAITISGQNFYSFDATYVYDNGVSVGTFNYPTLNETAWDGIYTIPISTTSGFELGGIYASGYILPYIVEYINEGSQTTFKLVYAIPIFVMLGLLMASGYLIFKRD